ncbi:MAG: hypothetical protein R3D86_06145 [Emcibacteraceae bacterium]
MQATKKDPYSESSAPPSQIEELYQYIRTFRRFPNGYRAIHMHFSILDRLHQQPHHRRAIATAFNKLVNSYEGKLFWTQNFDFFFVCKGCPTSRIEAAKFDAIRAVNDSPILKQIIDNSKDDELCDWYDLSTEYEKFYDFVEKLRRGMNEGNTENVSQAPNLKTLMTSLDQDNMPVKNKPSQNVVEKKEQKTVPSYEHLFQKSITPAIGPIQLDKLERNVLNMDMYSLIDEQNICVVVDNLAPQIVFTKKYISLDEVNNSILPGYNISGDIWLFQRLTETFDLKLMQALIDYKSFPETVLSINMNVSTISTKEFDKFIAKQKSLSDHPLVLEITLFDIMSDLTAYYKAQEKINRLGCKICICKMDVQSLYVLNRELINVDFLKIRWKKNYLNALSQTDKDRIKEAIKTQGKMRVVLSDCDSEEAIKFGNELGIVMYQGFEIDKLQKLAKPS